MKEILEKQIELLDKIILSFKDAQTSLIKKEIQKLSKNIACVEEYSFEFEKLEELLTDKVRKSGFPSIYQYVNSQNDKNLSFLLAKLVEKLNELSLVMTNFKEMLDFENNYFEFVKSLFSNNTTSTYSKNGYDKGNANLFNKSY
ncbi:hypothetical protein SU69_01705 [Thermosipho melanesiensis]|uniref:FlgN family protein n=2 Tax=Thermosipho melanesiensis TaxID=46541 RepID=A6LJU6_THEM4|nr:hypothetical protein [Thermosipho melanesiensis]ABR30197.1 hypothetical protein Tmel_0327 [Thermosipho melanesiensis BI429]APT73395.1 hypothetical protein BW47_01760 [Thermosipho melanesiensis]OOC38209.1 hypothetical protein SU68_01715 [Thermosipho melanesiensis]OOC40038.1 hypothetical protein SU69_01705 [Thermosipho melanesiensis]OOC40058.1 hypothetical protein SU70_01700 [Thermosipho melanesiensis]